MNLEIIHVGLLGTNCYISWDEKKNCVVIDCGGEAAKVAAFLQEQGLHPSHLLLTHAHGDHMGGVADLKELFPEMQIVLGEQDAELVNDNDKSMATHVAPEYRAFKVDQFAKEGDEIISGEMIFRVLETPGHTRGGLSFLKGNELFCGDTLFQGSMGRTDLYGGDDEAMMRSLKRLGELPGYLMVFSGHGSPSNMDDERRSNPFLRQAMKSAR